MWAIRPSKKKPVPDWVFSLITYKYTYLLSTIEAIPIKEWYNFIPRVAYKTLDAEEAEEKFAQRGTILNMWALKINKKLKPEDEGAEIDDDETKKSKKSGKKTEKEFKISDMDDELMGSGDELDSDSDEEADKKKPDR